MKTLKKYEICDNQNNLQKTICGESKGFQARPQNCWGDYTRFPKARAGLSGVGTL